MAAKPAKPAGFRAVLAAVFDRPERAGGQAAPGPADEISGALQAPPRSLRLQTLIVLRWLALIGQAAAVMAAYFGLGLSVPLLWCLCLIGLSAWFNVTISLGAPGQRQARDWETAAQLCFDIVQISALLFLTGGVINPFALLLIAPVTLAAATLPGRGAAVVGATALAATLVISVWSLPLPWINRAGLELPLLFRIGSGVALATGIGFTGVYAWQAAAEAARMEIALNVTQSVLAREQRLSALGGLAAAAAHELGTPLATIQVVAKEMMRAAPEGPLREDAELMVSQAERCREILKRLTDEPETDDLMHQRMTLLQLVNEIIEPHLSSRIRMEAVVTGPPGLAQPEIRRLPEVLHAVASFVDNAVDFAQSEVLVTARFDARSVAVEVRDDGPGFSPEVLARLGQPYVTSRPNPDQTRSGHHGMGLGFFIAKTLLERTGAAVDFSTGRPRGAVVAARWDRAAIEAPALPPLMASNR